MEWGRTTSIRDAYGHSYAYTFELLQVRKGPENCVECADGYMRSGKDRICVKDDSGKVLSISNARYFTYGGLCIATAIIFQRSTLIADALGLFIGVYIPFAEYYLQNMDGELQPFVKQ